MSKGFSLIEILVVLALVMLGLAVTMPVLADMEQRYSMRAATTTLSSDLLAMRYRAISENAHYRLQFVDRSSYAIQKKTFRGWIEQRVRRFGAGVVLESNNTPVFTPDGSVTNMPTVYVSSGGRRYRKVSLAITGRVKVENVD